MSPIRTSKQKHRTKGSDYIQEFFHLMDTKFYERVVNSDNKNVEIDNLGQYFMMDVMILNQFIHGALKDDPKKHAEFISGGYSHIAEILKPVDDPVSKKYLGASFRVMADNDSILLEIGMDQSKNLSIQSYPSLADYYQRLGRLYLAAMSAVYASSKGGELAVVKELSRIAKNHSDLLDSHITGLQIHASQDLSHLRSTIREEDLLKKTRKVRRKVGR